MEDLDDVNIPNSSMIRHEETSHSLESSRSDCSSNESIL